MRYVQWYVQWYVCCSQLAWAECWPQGRQLSALGQWAWFQSAPPALQYGGPGKTAQSRPGEAEMWRTAENNYLLLFQEGETFRGIFVKIHG